MINPCLVHLRLISLVPPSPVDDVIRSSGCWTARPGAWWRSSWCACGQGFLSRCPSLRAVVAASLPVRSWLRSFTAAGSPLWLGAVAALAVEPLGRLRLRGPVRPTLVVLLTTLVVLLATLVVLLATLVILLATLVVLLATSSRSACDTCRSACTLPVSLQRASQHGWTGGRPHVFLKQASALAAGPAAGPTQPSCSSGSAAR